MIKDKVRSDSIKDQTLVRQALQQLQTALTLRLCYIAIHSLYLGTALSRELLADTHKSTSFASLVSMLLENQPQRIASARDNATIS